MYYEWYQRNKKPMLLGILLFLIVTISWGVWIYASRAGKIAVTLSAVPGDASITLNDQPIGSGTTWLTAGTYTVKAQKQGFQSREKKITITDSKDQNVVALGLIPQSEEAKQWAEKNAQLYKNNETYGAIEAQTNGQFFQEKNPIVSQLPYNDPYFQITYTSDKNNNAVLHVSTPSPRYRYFAIQKIREFGYDPGAYKIHFTDFKNPLEQQ